VLCCGIEKIRENELFEEAEGTLYGAGITDRGRHTFMRFFYENFKRVFLETTFFDLATMTFEKSTAPIGLKI